MLDTEQAALGIDNLQITGIAVVVAQTRQLGVKHQGFHLISLRGQLHPGFFLVDQRIIDFTESLLDGLLIGIQRLLLLCFGDLQLTEKRATGKDGQVDGGPVLPNL